MTIARPAAITLLHPRPFHALHGWAGASIAAKRRTRRHPPRNAAFAPPLTVWQLDPHELTTALERSHW